MTTDKLIQRATDFWNKQERYLVSVYSEKYQYRQCCNDQTILESAPGHVAHQRSLPGVNFPTFFADFGTVTNGTFWGGKPRRDSTGENIFLDPVAQTIDEALALDIMPPDHPDLDAARALRLFRELRSRPELEDLWFRTTDFQGPLNTAGLVLKEEELFVAMYTDPGKVHAFLAKVTDFLVELGRYFMRESGSRVCGNIWPYTFLPCDLGLSITEDLMPLLSPEQYREFGIPYVKRLADEFGSLLIHCCGPWGRHVENLAAAGINICGVEFHYPFTRIEELAPLADTTVFVPYLMVEKQNEFKSHAEYYDHLLMTTGDNYRYWFPFYFENGESLQFAKDHGF